MKQVLFLALTLISLNSFSAIWDPHEKVILSILRRAERTPEAELNRKHSNIEQLRVDRAYFETNVDCEETDGHRFGGITKYTTRHLETRNCSSI